MNPVIFMSRVMPHCGGDGNFSDLPSVLLTCAIVGVILFILGILANILYVKFSRGFSYTPIHWADIKPDIDNTILGAMCGAFSFAFIGAAVLIGLVVSVFWLIVTL